MVIPPDDIITVQNVPFFRCLDILFFPRLRRLKGAKMYMKTDADWSAPPQIGRCIVLPEGYFKTIGHCKYVVIK